MPLSTVRVANNCITRARNILAASTNPAISNATRQDLRRLALVMSVVALDAYCHWTVFLRLGNVRRAPELPGGLRKLDIPFEDVASIADNVVDTRRRHVDSRPWVLVKNAVQRQLLRRTMQSSNDVSESLSLIGLQNIWPNVANRLGMPAQQVRSKLNRIVMRRNQIVHEGDIPRQQRPRRLLHNLIARVDVSADIDFMRSLIDALNAQFHD